jgi:hypothetical protein
MLSLHDQSGGPWILLHVALDKGRFNMAVCGRYMGRLGKITWRIRNILQIKKLRKDAY